MANCVAVITAIADAASTAGALGTVRGRCHGNPPSQPNQLDLDRNCHGIAGLLRYDMTSIALDLVVSCGDKLFDSVCIRNCSTVRVPLENPEVSLPMCSGIQKSQSPSLGPIRMTCKGKTDGQGVPYFRKARTFKT